MAHHKDAIKRIRTSRAANARNRADRSRMRSQVKELRAAIDGKDAAAAQKSMPETVSELHKMVKKGVIHKRNAARRISRLQKAVNQLGK
ncbi:MAG: 30S ribosomal protein S20 [Myxococcota bacterium]